VDPDSLNPDPDTASHVNLDPDPTRIQGFDDQKLKKKQKYRRKFIYIYFFSSKIVIYLSPSYRRSLPPSKENIQHPIRIRIQIQTRIHSTAYKNERTSVSRQKPDT
jgi:hypothetical protein